MVGNLLSTSKIILPEQLASGIAKDIQTGSTIGVLTGRKPMRFGDVKIVTFNKHVKAEFVDEGASKSGTTTEFGSVKAVPHKAQVTVRVNEEVQWADEDHQLEVLSTVSDEIRIALSRALDLGVYYRLNPLSGKPLTWENYLNSTTKRVQRTLYADQDIKTAVGLLLKDKTAHRTVNGIAMDPAFAYDVADRTDSEGRPLYPNLGFGINMSQFNGLPVSVSDTVGAPEFTAPSASEYTVPNVGGIVGDFKDGIYYGIQREITLEKIPYGDPDGQGDLKHNNQIALRGEVLYAWYVFPDRFAVIEGDVPTGKSK